MYTFNLLLQLNVWYLCSATSSITDALLAYEKSFKAAEYNSARPAPPYKETSPHRTQPYEDLRYHLLQLYSKRSHPLEVLLNPSTHTSDRMDFRLTWLLLQVLETIGYHHCSDLATAQLHNSFASQLENNGMWHWSIFVYLHLKNREQRELCIQSILFKYIQLPDEYDDMQDDDDYLEKETFIVEQLNIPRKWICWAKAVRAGSMNKHHLQADYLLKAKQWARAHEVIMQHITPDAIINGKTTKFIVSGCSTFYFILFQTT